MAKKKKAKGSARADKPKTQVRPSGKCRVSLIATSTKMLSKVRGNDG